MKFASLVLLSVVLLFCVGCGSSQVDTIAKLTANAGAGKVAWTKSCASCHASDGTGQSGVAPDLTKTPISDASFIGVVLNGESTMPAFKETLSNQNIADLLAHFRANIQKK